MLQNIPSMPRKRGREERVLYKIYKNLDSNNQQTLITFANFLAEQQSQEKSNTLAVNTTQNVQPLGLPRPQQESVIKGIRRLTKNYPMLDTDSMFDNISQLMTAHIMEGRSAKNVIDDLETLFAQQYALLDINNG